MHIELPPELEAFVEQEFATGRYATREDVVVQALRCLREERQKALVGIQQGLDNVAVAADATACRSFRRYQKRICSPHSTRHGGLKPTCSASETGRQYVKPPGYLNEGNGRMPPGIGVDIERIIAVAEDGKEFLTGETNIEISGNREGLLKLAELITNVAHSGKVGYHTHLMSNDKPPLLRSEDMWLTISLNSQK